MSVSTHEARGGMAAIEQPEVDDLGMRPIELDMPGIEVVRIVGDIGLGDETVASIPLDRKSMRAESPAQRGSKGATAESMENCGEMASATCTPTRLPSRIAP